MEQWRTVEAASGYEVSDRGNVKAISGKCLTLTPNQYSGYISVSLVTGSRSTITRSVHRLVALAFLPDPESGQTHVNHIDHNRSNNVVSNLEWASPAENNAKRKDFNHSVRVRAVVQLSEDGKELQTWDSGKRAAKALGVRNVAIYRACRTGYLTTCRSGRFRWAYQDELAVAQEGAEWRQVEHEKGPFWVTADGRVMTKTRVVARASLNANGYPAVNNVLVHRLVARAFLEPPTAGGRTLVNHIDGNRSNNAVANLEWVTYRENALHAFQSSAKPVNRISEDGSVQRYPSISEASRANNIAFANLSRVCSKPGRTAGGFRWEYAEPGVAPQKVVAVPLSARKPGASLAELGTATPQKMATVALSDEDVEAILSWFD